MKTYVVRAVGACDFAAVASLLGQLGYAVDEAEVAARIAEIRSRGGEVLVAVDERGRAVGCVQALVDVRLAEGRLVELVSLVVDETCRGRGLGGVLVRAVETWALDSGAKVLRIRCNAKRDAAKRFYAKAGFVETKEQAIFEKDLGRPA